MFSREADLHGSEDPIEIIVTVVVLVQRDSTADISKGTNVAHVAPESCQWYVNVHIHKVRRDRAVLDVAVGCVVHIPVEGDGINEHPVDNGMAIAVVTLVDMATTAGTTE